MVAQDSSGKIWFSAEGGPYIGSFDPEQELFTLYYMPDPNSGSFGIAVDPDGNVWFTEVEIGMFGTGNKIGRLTPDTNTFAEWTLPNPSSQPAGIAIDLQGRVWFTETYGNRIGNLDPATNTVTEYTLPPPAPSNPYPMDLSIDSQGNIWFTEQFENWIGRITISLQAQIQVDKGCGATYQIGEPIRVTFMISQPSGVVIQLVKPDGTVKPLFMAFMMPAGTHSVPSYTVVEGPPGTHMLEMQPEAHCSFIVIEPRPAGPLRIQVSAKATQVCGPSFSHELEVSWKISGGKPPYQVTIEITDPSGLTQTFSAEALEGTKKFQLNFPGGGMVKIKATVRDSGGSSASAQASASLTPCQ